MRVKFCFVDSGTGENDVVTLSVKNMSQSEFERVFNQYINYGEEESPLRLELKSLINHGQNWVATFTHHCAYFGPVLITGIVYTNFK
jgi:hypothetical protein